MSIGNFQKTDEVSTEPKEEVQKEQATPAKKMVEGITSSMKTNVELHEDAAQRGEDWRDVLKGAGISIDKAQGMIDDMLTQGYYEETYAITKKVRVTFRSRSQQDYKRYLRTLDVLNPRFNDEMQEIAMRYFLSASIVAFHGKSFHHVESTSTKTLVEEAFEERMAWVEQQSDHVMMLLRAKLSTFDNMLSVVFSEGVIENF